MKLITNFGEIHTVGNIHRFIPAEEHANDFEGLDLFDYDKERLSTRVYDWICLTPHLISNILKSQCNDSKRKCTSSHAEVE